MPLLAILNSRARLDELIAAGERIGAVATRTSEVAEAAAVAGIPCVTADDAMRAEERAAVASRAFAITSALAGSVVPAPSDVPALMWWALEWPLCTALVGGARVRRALEVALRLAPATSGIVHDAEGWVQGGIVAAAAEELGLPSVGLPPGTLDVMHTPQDTMVCPVVRDGVVVAWRGRVDGDGTRPTVIVLHTNEVAHLVRGLWEDARFALAMDARQRWKDVEQSGFRPQVLDANPVEDASLAPLVDAVWPGGDLPPMESWERSLAEAMFVTYQPFVREECAWASAAYSTRAIRAFLGGSDSLPEVRARLAACRELGIPTVLVQHGALNRRERMHFFGDVSLVWGRSVVRDLRAAGCSRRLEIIGWPQASVNRRPAARRRAARGSQRRPWLIVTAVPSFDISADPYGRGEVFLCDALRAVHAVAPGAPVIVKIHPREDAETVRRFCVAHGSPDVVIATGRDGWPVIADAELVLSAKSTSVFAAVHLGVRVVVYHPSPTSAWFDRFREIPVATTYEELVSALRRGAQGRGTESVSSHARADTNAAARVLAVLRSSISPRVRSSACVEAAPAR